MRVSFRFFCIVCMTMVLCSACSGADNPQDSQNPVVPSVTTRNSENSVSNNGRLLFGLWTVRINEDLTVEISPNRAVEMHLNLVHFLESNCSDCLTISQIQALPDDRISALLTLKHPLPGPLNYCAFDVRGIFISEADFTFPDSGKSIAWGDDVPRMLTFDGYTELFNPTDFPPTFPLVRGYIPGEKAPGGNLTATLNPYLAFNPDLERRIFQPGTTSSRSLELHVKNLPVEFGYAVDGCWQQVDEPVTDPIAQFPSDANALEPYHIDIQCDKGNSLLGGSNATISTYVYDFQGLDTIESVLVEAPDFFDGTVALEYKETNLDGGWFGYKGTIENTKLADYGTYPLLVRVIDTQPDQNLGSIDAWELYTLEIERGWAYTIGGAYGDEGDVVAIDSEGFVYVLGGWDEIVDFDPSLDWEFHEALSDQDAYLIKFDPYGNFVWVRTWQVNWGTYGSSIAIDSLNNIYVCGCFQYGVDLDPGDIVDMHASNGHCDTYLSKFNSDGEYLWGRTWGGLMYDYGDSVAVHADDHVYVTGRFDWTVDFDPGPGIEERAPTLGLDSYLSCFDSDGNFLWVRNWSSLVSTSYIQNVVVVDSWDYAYVAGAFWKDDVDFDPGPGDDTHQCNGVFDAFLSKFDSSGEFQWARTWGGIEDDIVESAIIDPEGGMFIVGGFHDTVDFDPDAGVDNRTSNGNQDAYMMRLGVTGELEWVDTWGGPVTDNVYSVAIGQPGTLYVSGAFYGTSDFDPGPGVEEHTSTFLSDAYLSRFNSDGSFLWTRTWGGEDIDDVYCTAVDSLNCAYVTGKFSKLVDFEPGPGVEEIWSNGGYDAFLLRFTPDGYW